MPVSTIQQRFTRGEINPKLLSRNDVEMYYSSCKEMRNVISIPYGGFSRRLGTKFVANLLAKTQLATPQTITASNGGSGALASDGNRSTYFTTNNLSTFTGDIAIKYSYASSKTIRNIIIQDAYINSEEAVIEATISGGVVTAVSILIDGQGYTGSLALALPAGAGAGSGAILTPTVTAGVVTSVAITNAGSGYTDGTYTLELSETPDSTITVNVEGSTDDSNYTEISEITLTRTAGYFNLSLDADYRYIRLTKESAEAGVFSINLSELAIYEEVAGNSTVRMIPFIQSTSNSYILILSNQRIDIYKNDAVVYSAGVSGLDESYLSDIKYTQFADTCIITQKDMKPKRIFRIADDNWLIEDIVFDGIPYYSFSSEEVKTSPLGTITPSDTEGRITLTLSTAYTGDPVGQFVEGNGGRARVISKTSNTKFEASVVIPFYGTSAIANGSWTITTSYEESWSSSRGYPISCTFYQNRLWFGGTKSRPMSILGSKVGLYYNFLPSSGYDNDAIDVDISSSRLDEIVNLYSQRTLQIYATGAEYSIPQSVNQPITPTTISIKNNTKNGSYPNTPPVDVDGVVLFVERNGRCVINFVYDDVQQAYTSTNESILNSHLIEAPLDLAVDLNNKYEQASYIYMPKTDGDMVVSCIMINQNVAGYTLWQTDGDFKSVCVLPDAVYFVVERNNALLLEKQYDTTLDSIVEVTSGFSTSVTGLDHLEGDTVHAIIDGDYNKSYTVVSGAITLDTLPTTSLEVGLNYTVSVKGNPIEIPNVGNMTARRNRIAELTVRLYESRNISVNGEELDLDSSTTSDYNFNGIGYWTDRDSYTITQTKPMPLTVLGIQMFVNYEVQDNG